YLKAFESKEYQRTFPWVDQVKQVHPKGELAQSLDRALVEKLQTAWANNGIVEDCWLAVPDIVDWSIVNGFKFTRSTREGVASDLHLPGLVSQYPREEPSIEFLRMHHAMSVNDEEQVIDRWPLYRCVHCEIDHGGKAYILSAGHWFEVSKDFVQEVSDYVASIPAFQQPLPIYNHDSEDHYNRELAANSDGSWDLMDKKLLAVG